MDNIKHFENLWEEAESLSEKTIKENKEDIVNFLVKSLKEYPLIENESTRFRKYGEILFYLSKLSLIDNINVYGALQLNIKYAKINVEE